MRALKSIVPISVVLALLGTVMPVSAGQSTSNLPPDMQTCWRYQVPLPSPGEPPEPGGDRVVIPPPFQRSTIVEIFVTQLWNSFLERGNLSPLW